MVGKIYDVLFFHPSLVVHAMLKYNSRMVNQKTKQTRGNSAASEDKINCIIPKRTRGYSAAPEDEINDIIKKLHSIQTLLADRKHL